MKRYSHLGLKHYVSNNLPLTAIRKDACNTPELLLQKQ